MIDLPTALEKVLNLKLTEDQFNDLYDYFTRVHDDAIDEGYQARDKELSSERDEYYNEGFDEGHRTASEYYEARLDDEIAGSYKSGYDDGYSEGLEAGAETLDY
jgi:hypothetical protein